jgi:hypothetical protein
MSRRKIGGDSLGAGVSTFITEFVTCEECGTEEFIEIAKGQRWNLDKDICDTCIKNYVDKKEDEYDKEPGCQHPIEMLKLPSEKIKEGKKILEKMKRRHEIVFAYTGDLSFDGLGNVTLSVSDFNHLLNRNDDIKEKENELQKREKNLTERELQLKKAILDGIRTSVKMALRKK